MSLDRKIEDKKNLILKDRKKPKVERPPERPRISAKSDKQTRIERNKKPLHPIAHAFYPVFHFPDSIKWRLAGKFSFGFKDCYNYHGPQGEDVHGSYINSVHNPYLVFEMDYYGDDKHGRLNLAVKYNYSDESFEVAGFSKKGFKRVLGGTLKSFKDPDELIDYLENQIAEVLAANEINYSRRMLTRGAKLASVTAVFLWASGAFGQEAEPANDVLLEPEEPAAHLVIEQP